MKPSCWNYGDKSKGPRLDHGYFFDLSLYRFVIALGTLGTALHFSFFRRCWTSNQTRLRSESLQERGIFRKCSQFSPCGPSPYHSAIKKQRVPDYEYARRRLCLTERNACGSNQHSSLHEADHLLNRCDLRPQTSNLSACTKSGLGAPRLLRTGDSQRQTGDLQRDTSAIAVCRSARR